jgi:hypothetical protein
MTADNWRDCRDLVDEGCQTILSLESCPLQFACDDEDGPGPILISNGNYTVESDKSCDTIVASNSFDGTCCSLTNTETGGCTLTVVNGMCTTVGPTWNVAATSTLSDACPEGDYDVLANNHDNAAGSKAGLFAVSAMFMVIGTMMMIV